MTKEWDHAMYDHYVWMEMLNKYLEECERVAIDAFGVKPSQMTDAQFQDWVKDITERGKLKEDVRLVATDKMLSEGYYEE
jgi:hypothetical protein